jgi:hypothetical protein
MTGMKRIKKLIAAWTTTCDDPVTRIISAQEEVRLALNSNPIPPRDHAVIMALFADAIDLAKQKTEASS